MLAGWEGGGVGAEGGNGFNSSLYCFAVLQFRIVFGYFCFVCFVLYFFCPEVPKCSEIGQMKKRCSSNTAVSAPQLSRLIQSLKNTFFRRCFPGFETSPGQGLI